MTHTPLSAAMPFSWQKRMAASLSDPGCIHILPIPNAAHWRATCYVTGGGTTTHTTSGLSGKLARSG